MNEVLDADSLEVVGASGSAGDNKFGTTVEVLECSGSELGIFVVAGAEDDDIGALGESGVNTLFYGLEAEVIDDFVTCAAEEVGGELSASETHGEVADGEHEYLGTLGSGFGSEAQFLEVGGGALATEFLALGGVFATVA